MSDQSIQDGTAGLGTEGHVSRPVLLSQAREAAGLHIAALAAALKVPVKKLEALEAGRYNELPDLVFARALASSACRQLKVDPAPILQQIPAGVTPQLGNTGTSINTPFKPSSGGTPANPVGWLSRPAVLAAMALMVGALLLVFLPDMTPTEESMVNPPVTDALPNDPKDPAPSAVAEGATAPASTQVQSATLDGTVAVLTPVLPSVPTQAVLSAATEATSLSATDGDVENVKRVLAIRAKGESWVQVTDGTGTVVIQRMLQAGDAVGLSAAPPYAVVVGRVDNAEVLIRGRTFDATPFARNGVARFEVK